MSGQMMEMIGYIVAGVSGVLLILSEVIFRKRKKTIVNRIYERLE